MSDLTEKEALLEAAGYRYHFDRMIYFNREARKAFSLEFVEDHSHELLTQLLQEASNQEEWSIYFNEEPSESLKRQLRGALER